MYFEYHYTVNTRDTDPFGHCRPSSLLSLLQEAATEAALDFHVSREEMLEKHNAFWMLARIWYQLKNPLHWNDTLLVRTWHRGGKGASMYRDYDLYLGEEWVGEAVSTWVLADADTHKPLRLSQFSEFTGTTGEGLCKSKLLTKVRLPEGMALTEQRQLHYSDADVNRHVNNSKYADFACDALHLETRGEGQFVSALQVGFLAECRPGEVLELYTGECDGTCFVHGTDQGGKSRFDAAVTLSPWAESRS